MDKTAIKWKPTKKLQVNPAKIRYEVDPIQDERIRDRMIKNPEYARIMSINKSKLFYSWIKKKLELKENILIEIKGYTRSGKSIVGMTIAKLIAKLVGRDFTQYQVCKNESEYFKRLRIWSKLKKSFNSSWVVDEQVETHVGIGCLTEGHDVLTTCGWKKIETISDTDRVLCIDRNTLKTVESKFKLLKRKHIEDLYKLLLWNGLELEMTPEHPLLVLDKNGKLNWKEAREINEDDYVGVLDEVKLNIEETNELTNNKARLLGFVIGDGYVAKNGFVSFVNSNKNILDDFENIIKEEFNVKVTKHLKPRTEIGTKDCWDYRVHGKAYHYLKRMLKVKLKVSEIIFLSNKKIKGNFLKGLYSTDGSISKRGNGNVVTFYSISKELCDGVKLLLLEFGINARVYETKLKGSPHNPNHSYTMFSVLISKHRNIKKFYKEIGFIDNKRQKRLKKICMVDKNGRDNFSIPYIWKQLEMDFTNKNRAITNNVKPPKNGKVSKYKLKRISKYCRNEYIRNLANSDLNFVKVKQNTKKKNKECLVYDLTVPKHHNFFVNGIVSHNSYSEMNMQEDLNNIIAIECLTGDTKIQVYDNDVIVDIELEKLRGRKRIVLPSFNTKTLEVEKDSAIFLDSGRKEVFEIMTTNGKKIKASENHIFFVVEDGKIKEKYLKDLKKGDKLVKI